MSSTTPTATLLTFAPLGGCCVSPVLSDRVKKIRGWLRVLLRLIVIRGG
jgi:chemotaxis receptor (MCP) glutamine deamidase CheD